MISGMHVASRDLALYVLDALDAEQKDRVEAHVLGCAACAEGLAREARLEAAFEAVARRDGGAVIPIVRAAHEPARARRAWQHRAAGGVAGALAAAAAIVLALASTAPRSEPMGASARGASLDAAQQALSAGLLSDYAEPGALEAARESSDKLDGG